MKLYDGVDVTTLDVIGIQLICHQIAIDGKYSGIIYKYTNTINNKVYIGQTTRPFVRNEQHKGCKPEFPFGIAIHKYGWQAFQYSVLELAYADSQEELSEQLNDLEIYYIAKYDTHNVKNGYNCTDGGTYMPSIKPKSKSVDMYTPDGKFVQTFQSISAANLFCNMTGCSIRNVCNHLSNTAAGYLWAWHGNDVVIPSNKQIACYDLNGMFVERYDNASDAARKMNKKYGSICQALNDKHRIAYGHYWRNYVTDRIPITDFPKAIFVYDAHGKFKKAYKCYQDAVRILKLKASTSISHAIHSHQIYRGEYWRDFYVKQLSYDDMATPKAAIKVFLSQENVTKIYSQIKLAALDNNWTVAGVNRALRGKYCKEIGNAVVTRYTESMNPNTHPDWIYVDDKIASKKIPKTVASLIQPVDQYTKEGVLVASYSSISEAERIIKVHNVKTAIHKNQLCNGFIWVRHGEQIPQIILDKIEKSKVYYYHLDGTYGGFYYDRTEASLAIGYSSSNSHISRCIKEQWRTAKGFYWRNYKVDKISIVKNPKET